MKRARNLTADWMAAAFGALALVIQGLGAAPLMAAEMGGGAMIEICSAEGLQTIMVDQGGQPMDEEPCDHCPIGCISPALVEAPRTDVAADVAYPVQRRTWAPPANRPLPKAAGPPRPPGQAPPVF
jgi:hypothetical protein